MKSLVYEPSLAGLSSSSFLGKLGNRIGMGQKLKLKNIQDPVVPDGRHIKLKTRMCGI